MRTLYIDCSMGAAGDMLTAALSELLPDRDEFINEINSMGIPGVTVTAVPCAKCGINGTHISVVVNGEEEGAHMHEHSHQHEHAHEHHHDHEHEHHHHSSLHDIEHIISHLKISEKVKKDASAVYTLIAEAESHAHGVPVTQIHFHEVGTMDAIADIVSVCLLMEKLNVQKVIASPVHVGSGQVKCAHGILPVPAPATAYILKGIPMYSADIKCELCTPTGAALLKHFADEFGQMPIMRTSAIGYGMGKKDLPAANCVRVLLGETNDDTETVTELSCNIDDMTAEAIGHALGVMFDAGALEAYTIPCTMKKSRPGVLFCVMCKSDRKDDFIKLIFKHTTTLGIRDNISNRYTLERKIKTIDTPFGSVRKKISNGYGVIREKYEYDDIARISREYDMSVDEVKSIIK